GRGARTGRRGGPARGGGPRRCRGPGRAGGAGRAPPPAKRSGIPRPAPAAGSPAGPPPAGPPPGATPPRGGPASSRRLFVEEVAGALQLRARHFEGDPARQEPLEGEAEEPG